MRHSWGFWAATMTQMPIGLRESEREREREREFKRKGAAGDLCSF